MDFEEKTLNSKVVYQGRILTVCKDDVVTADGYNSFREVVLHNGGVVVVALKDDNKILMVKQYRYPLKNVNIELPAGKLEIGENPDFAAKRELQEETGYKAEFWDSLGYINTTPGFCNEKLHLYFAKDLEFVGENPDEGEVIKCCEYDIKQIKTMINNGQICDSKTICALSKAFIKGYINL